MTASRSLEPYYRLIITSSGGNQAEAAVSSKGIPGKRKRNHALAAKLLIVFNDIAPWLVAEAGMLDAHRVLRGFKNKRPRLLRYTKEALSMKVEQIRDTLGLSRREAWKVLAR